MDKLKQTRRVLLTLLWSGVVASLLLVAVFELSPALSGLLAQEETLEFCLATLMELLALASIPLALRLFKFQKVRSELLADKETALRKWGVVRLALLVGQMFVDTLLYYMFINTTFGYMAIILLLCLPFVYPTKERCQSEIEE